VNSANIFNNGGNVGIQTTTPGFTFDVNGTAHALTAFVVGTHGSQFVNDQGGALELGGNNTTASPSGAIPYVDFHYGTGAAQDFNVRLINSADQRLSYIASSNGNTLNFTSGWQSTPDPTTNVAEISNDTGTFKTLMIVGNKSAGTGERRVSIWDRLTVNGTLCVNGDCSNSLWPSGSYCILQHGGSCPAGFAQGQRHWDDEDIANANSASGTLPDGTYDSNTTMDFCCK
jgi:hypothetical protein